MRRLPILLAILMLLALLPGAPVAAQDAGTGSDNLTPVDTFEYGKRSTANSTNYGTDSDFADMEIAMPDGEGGTEVQVRSVGVFGSIHNGAFIMDLTDGIPVELGYYACPIGQGDVQVFQREEDRGTATYFTYADDGYSRGQTPDYGDNCVDWARDNADDRFGNGQGSYIVDITDPRDPQTVGFLSARLGSHNGTVHPSGEWFYNSNSELITNAANAGIEVYDIRDLTNPVQVTTLALDPRPGLGTDAHDITFNEDGTRAYAAALSQTVIIDTTDPADPSIVSSFVDPMINVEHQSDPITIDDPLLGERDFLIVEDELAGAAGAEPACPSGGVHVYDITGDLEQTPIKVGYWNISDIMPTDVLGSCTAHVFQLHPEAGLMTISFYNGGIRVVDIRGLVGVALGGQGIGMREIGFHYFDDSNSWSVKTPSIEVGDDGELDFFLYSNDINRGLDTYHFVGNIDGAGTGMDLFMTAAEASVRLPVAVVPTDYRPFCLLGDDAAETSPVTAPLTQVGKLLGG